MTTASNSIPQRKPREGTSALVPGVSVFRLETPRWSGWAVRASRQEGTSQRIRTWTLRAHTLDGALLEACAWRAEYSGDDPADLYDEARDAVSRGVRRKIDAWSRSSD